MMPTTETTEPNTSMAIVAATDTGLPSLTPEVERKLRTLYLMQNAAVMLGLLSRCSDETGGYVQLLPQYHYVPVLIGTENNIVPLYELVEVMDDVLDYEVVLRQFPHLTYAQVGGAISFLRKIAQSNPTNIDIDEIEDAAMTSDPAFLDELRTALADEEISRVLNRD